MGSAGRLLCIDDEENAQLLVREGLRDAWEVLSCGTAEEGLERLRDEAPDFVIVDLGLPGMSGLEFIERARRLQAGACIPIVVLTGNDREAALLDCFRRGADDYVTKPFGVAELVARVSSIHMRTALCRDMNPLTRLPGNSSIRREVAERLREGGAFAVAYLDLDHFKAFNDTRGFDAGDESIGALAAAVLDWSAGRPEARAFVGHVGGDDFVVLLPVEEVDAFAAAVHRGFSARTACFYSEAELARGAVEIEDRRGRVAKVPLLSVSIAVVVVDPATTRDLREIAHRAAAVKHAAKQIPGNSLFVDRRGTAAAADVDAERGPDGS